MAEEKAIAIIFTCPCRPGFEYKSKSALDAHKKTKMHLAYEKNADLKNSQLTSKKLENEMESLKLKIEQKERIEEQLLVRIKDLERENKWLKRHLNKKQELDQINNLIANKLFV